MQSTKYLIEAFSQDGELMCSEVWIHGLSDAKGIIKGHEDCGLTVKITELHDQEGHRAQQDKKQEVGA